MFLPYFNPLEKGCTSEWPGSAAAGIVRLSDETMLLGMLPRKSVSSCRFA